MEPLRHLLHLQFQAASEKYEVQQRAAVARKLLEKGAPNREWMLTLAAKGTHEAKFFEQLATLYDDVGVWQILPASSLTVAERAILFKMISRA
eukprot:6487617-Amphidinium_carterae.1